MYDQFTVKLALELLDVCSQYNPDDESVMEIKVGIGRWADTGDIEFLEDAYRTYYFVTGFPVMQLGYDGIMEKLNKRKENQNVVKSLNFTRLMDLMHCLKKHRNLCLKHMKF